MNSGTKDSLEAGAGLTLLDGSLLNNHFKMEVEEGFCSPKPSDVKVRCVTIQPGATARPECVLHHFTFTFRTSPSCTRRRQVRCLWAAPCTLP